MIEQEFLAELVRDPDTVLARYELDDAERAAVRQAVGRCGATSSSAERAQAFQSILMKRWST
jgi:hypothetical protein